MMTPFDKLKPLPDAQRYLKPGITFEMLNDLAIKQTDLDAWENYKRLAPSYSIQSLLKPQKLHEHH